MFKAETNIVSDVPLDSLDARIRIRESIECGNISQAISLVNDLHPEILDNDRNCFYQLQVYFIIYLFIYFNDLLFIYLIIYCCKISLILLFIGLPLHNTRTPNCPRLPNYFSTVQQQFFVELIKQDKLSEAITFAQTHLSEHVSKVIIKQKINMYYI